MTVNFKRPQTKPRRARCIRLIITTMVHHRLKQEQPQRTSQIRGRAPPSELIDITDNPQSSSDAQEHVNLKSNKQLLAAAANEIRKTLEIRYVTL